MLTSMTLATQGRVPEDTLAHRLRIVRRDLGWSQREAAARTGLSFGDWQSIENGHDARGLDKKVKAIAEASGYNAVWIMWGEIPDGLPATTEIACALSLSPFSRPDLRLLPSLAA